MRVNPDKFFVATRFHRHEAVRKIVEWANTTRKDKRYGTQAHRIKCIVLKRYKIGKELIPLCPEWEQFPWEFCTWLAQQPAGCRIQLVEGAAEFSPSTIRMQQL